MTDNVAYTSSAVSDNSSADVAHEASMNFHFSGVRKHTSIRCDSNLWKEFRTVCESNGFSTCDCLEKLVLGFLVGVQLMCHKPTTINVMVDAPRVVKRVRRRQLVFEDEVVEDTVVGELCSYCKRDKVRREAVGEFRYVPTGKEYPLCSFHARELLNGRGWQPVNFCNRDEQSARGERE